MKLIKHEVVLNDDDSTPEFEVTLRIPVDPLVEDIARNENLYTEWGEKFIDTITKKETKEDQ